MGEAMYPDDIAELLENGSVPAQEFARAYFLREKELNALPSGEKVLEQLEEFYRSIDPLPPRIHEVLARKQNTHQNPPREMTGMRRWNSRENMRR